MLGLRGSRGGILVRSVVGNFYFGGLVDGIGYRFGFSYFSVYCDGFYGVCLFFMLLFLCLLLNLIYFFINCEIKLRFFMMCIFKGLRIILLTWFIIEVICFFVWGLFCWI